MSPFPWIIALSLAVGFILLFLGYLTRSPKRTYRGWTENLWVKELRDDVRRATACESLVNALENGTQSEAFFAMLVFSKVHLPAEERDRVCSAIRNAIGRDDLLLEDLGLRDCASTTIIVGNVTYYSCGPTWYRRTYTGGSTTYIVVGAPAGH